MSGLKQQIEKILETHSDPILLKNNILGLLADYDIHPKGERVCIPIKQLEERFEQIYEKMNKEQDSRIEKGESGRFPYYFMEAIMRDLEKLLLEGSK